MRETRVTCRPLRGAEARRNDNTSDLKLSIKIVFASRPPHCPGPEFREFFSEIWATVRCSENSVIFGRHAERSVTDEMSSFHSERLTPDNGQGEKDKEGRRGVADLTIFALRGSSAPLRQQ